MAVAQTANSPDTRASVSARTRTELDAVLLELDIPERNLQACLLDPFAALLRGIDPGFSVCVTRAPTSPYIVSSSSASKPSPSQLHAPSSVNKPYTRPGSDETRISAPSTELPPVGFVGKVRRKPIQVVPKPEESHHASIVSDISAAVDAIRSRWIETEPLRGHAEWWAEDYESSKKIIHSRARLKLDEKKLNPHSGAPRWADITRSPSRTDLADVTHVNMSIDAMLHIPLLDHYAVHLPPKSGFSLSLLDQFPQVVSNLEHVDGWDAIVIDFSLTVRHGKTNQHLVAQSENGHKRALVAIWVTNRPKFRRFLMSKFMPDSQIVGPYAQWYWVKITASPMEQGKRSLSEGGKPIFDLSSNSPRRCYEGLILGWYTPPSLRTTEFIEILPPKKVILSTPLDHSRKPNLADLLQPYLPSNSNFLELFARTVSSCKSLVEPDRSGDYSSSSLPEHGFWHSVGDESPKFNGSPWLEKDSTKS